MKERIFIILALLFHLFLLINNRFTLWPEIVSYPYLLLHNFTLYKDFVHPYPPLLTIMLAAIFRFVGFNIFIIKAMVWATILISDVLLIKIAKFFKLQTLKILGLIVSYALLQTYLDGNMFWYDTALTLPFLLFIYFLSRKKLLKASFAIPLLCLIKQTAVISLFIFILYLVLNKEFFVIKKGFYLALALGALLLFYLYRTNSLLDSYLWVLYYPTHFWSQFPGYIQLNLTFREFITVALISIPPIILFLKKKYRIISFLYLATVVAVYPRFSFFHFQPALALAFVSLFLISTNFTKRKFMLIYLCIFFLTLFIIKPYLAVKQIHDTRFFGNDDYEISSKIRTIVPAGSRVYFLNVPSQQYLLTDTIPPKPWIDNYGWYFEMPSVQQNALDEWSKNPPQYIVWKARENGSWYDIGVYEPKMVVNWIQQNYVQVLDIGNNTYIWKIKN